MSFAGTAILIHGARITTRPSIGHISTDVIPANSVKKAILRYNPNLDVVGNQVPEHLIPMKGEDSKYYNPDTKKCVNFPEIGSFEVYFQGMRLFSKKKTNAWPNYQEISKNITHVLSPN